MRTTWLKVAATVGVIAAASWTPRAQAQSSKVAAEALFEEGRRLIAQDNPAQACPKFVDSQRLDPSPSTLLNLGSCYEKLGKTASAWATYRGAASAANALGRQGLVSVAQRHAEAIEPELSRLAITPKTPVSGIEITRDGQLVGHGEWDVAVPVDPGVITVEASAPNKKRWSTTVEVTQRGKTVRLAVPALEDAPPEPSPPTTTSGVMAGPIAYDTAGPVPRRAAWQEPTALVAGGVGVAGLVLGTVFVLNAKSKYDDSLKLCAAGGNVCTPEGVSLRDDARSAGNVATVAYAAGAVSLAAGAVLWFTAPKKTEKAPTSAELHVSPSLGGLNIYGRW